MGKEGMPGREIAQSGVSSPHQKAVIIQPDPATEILLLKTTYQGPAAEFAWVIPVPGLPAEEDVFRVGEGIIPWILDETAPQVHSQITVRSGTVCRSGCAQTAWEPCYPSRGCSSPACS